MKSLAVILALMGTVNCPAGTIAYPPDAPPPVQIGAKEIRRYVWLCSGELLELMSGTTAQTDAIRLGLDPSLGRQQYRLKSDGRSLAISGGSAVAVLHGAYAFAEKLGVRFYLHGDVVPDVKKALVLSGFDETREPLFATRGILPFHDFPEGPDWWNQDDYLAHLGQLAKMRMNFLGVHCYPEGNVGPEPLVWIGQPRDLNPDGTVKTAYPARWANTAASGWNYAAMKTSAFSGGAAELFAEDDYGPDVQRGFMPHPRTPEESVELFNRTGRQMGVVFAAAKRLGIQTCIGTETPLTIPGQVRERVRQEGKDPADPQVVKELYTGMFQRIAAACPVDYYWLWTPEGWTWSGNTPAQFEVVRADIGAALAALKDLGHPFTLATSGWVLGPQHDRAALEEFLPAHVPMSCINRKVGHDGVEPAFANIIGRPKWAIPWLENDPNMVGPQPWVARMRYDAVDARRFGCNGLLGIHWRTRALAPNLAALAAAAWDQSWIPAEFDPAPVKPFVASDGAQGGQVAGSSEPVADAHEPAVYQTVRHDLKGYHLHVPAGTYTVTLQFNEPHHAEAGQRVFDVRIQGRPVLTGLDLFARAGRNQALDLSFPDIAIKDGLLRIEFISNAGSPCIAGIAIKGTTKAANQFAGEPFTRKINCGGGQIADYEADRIYQAGLPPAGRARAMPAADFHLDFARANFGDTVAEAAGALLARIDGANLPQVSDWKTGPGDLVANPAPWTEVRKRYAFVEEIAALRPRIQTPGNLERFDYWLDTYRGMAAMAEAACARGELDKAIAARDYGTALKARLHLAEVWTRLLTLQTSLVSTPGELGTLANLEQHVRKHTRFLTAHDATLEKALAQPLPDQCAPSQSYAGPARLIVPTRRTAVERAETLQLKIIALFPDAAKSVEVNFRPLGPGPWRTLAAAHVGRAVWHATLPAAVDDFEYYIVATSKTDVRLVHPATAPQINQTVVVEE
jgi:hypothetical protein